MLYVERAPTPPHLWGLISARAARLRQRPESSLVEGMRPVLKRVLEATGFFPDGEPAVGLRVGDAARNLRRGRAFEPDAVWRSPSSLHVYFKVQDSVPPDVRVSQWRNEIWNEGFAPLLWVISPHRIDLYNGFSTPATIDDAQDHLIRSFEDIDASLEALDAFAGRLAIETGQFWANAPMVDRRTSVDQRLLRDLSCLEKDLLDSGLARESAQALIGRMIFTQYLVDRGIVTAERLQRLCGHRTVSATLRDDAATARLFAWLTQTFNGDMFPASSTSDSPNAAHLSRVAEFLEAVDPITRQLCLFPYQFDVIPVELISSIYEQFAHSAAGTNEGLANGVHYTRLSIVSLVLDEVMDGLTGHESALDLTCGSGVFLVEVLRRLVHLRSDGVPPTRAIIRSTLYEQIFGVDISESAVRVAAFSLYLAALELDPNPRPARALKFQPLIGRTLFIGDARTIELTEHGAAPGTSSGVRKFDLVVGNPPWTFQGQSGTAVRRQTRASGVPIQPRGQGLDFVVRAAEFAHDKTRFGVILSATSFISRSNTGQAAAEHFLREFAPITLVNLANLSDWLFATARMPAVAMLARYRPMAPCDQVTVVQVPWTPDSARTHTFDISPSDVINLSVSDIEGNPLKLKAAAVGRRVDIHTLDSLMSRHECLGTSLDALGVHFRDGLTLGKPANRNYDANELKDLPFLQAKDLKHFEVPDDLETFVEPFAQWPRSRTTYVAPLLLVKEMFAGWPRAVAAVSDTDLVYTDGYFAASFAREHRLIPRLLAAILSSAVSSWFFGLTASEFGIYKRKLLIRDLLSLPVPELGRAVESSAGRRVLDVERAMRGGKAQDWPALDAAVFDLYELDDIERVVMRDGLVRGSWQWKEGRRSSALAADTHAVCEYARVFLTAIAGWLSARNKRHMRAEVLDLPDSSSLRIVRFVLENGEGPGGVTTVAVEGPLGDVLNRLGNRMNVQIATALSTSRELRVHGRNEVIVIKPAARRYWMGVSAAEDADAVIAESFTRGRE